MSDSRDQSISARQRMILPSSASLLPSSALGDAALARRYSLRMGKWPGIERERRRSSINPGQGRAGTAPAACTIVALIEERSEDASVARDARGVAVGGLSATINDRPLFGKDLT